ncbi:butyrophilin subfamily 1 member A1 isoform X2 [Lepisosteus oculatus]|uniref:butyrophilin subfamily 1 member A1 isoform X2 n=1 Tax=Lepisosteus oculatus TaxID=7918 RepID=UPI00371DDA7E
MLFNVTETFVIKRREVLPYFPYSYSYGYPGFNIAYRDVRHHPLSVITITASKTTTTACLSHPSALRHSIVSLSGSECPVTGLAGWLSASVRSGVASRFSAVFVMAEGANVIVPGKMFPTALSPGLRRNLCAVERRLPRRTGLWLWILTLSLWMWASPCVSGAGVFSVSVSSPIEARWGGSVLLPCWLSPNQSAEGLELRWYRAGRFETPVAFQPGKDPVLKLDSDFQGRASLVAVEELQKGNVSLRIERVSLQDAGQFSCYVSSDQWYEDKSVLLRVTAVGMPPVLRVVPMEDRGRLNVSCVSEGWSPQPWLHWTDDTGANVSAPAPHYSADPHGLVTASSWLPLAPGSHAWLACIVSHAAGQDGRESRVGLPHHTAEDSRSADWRIAFITLLVLMLLLVISAALFIWKHWKDQKHHSPTDKTAGKETEKEQLLGEWGRMIDAAVDVTLDLKTAHPLLKLTPDGKKVRDALDPDPARPDSPRRFRHHTCVLGCEGFSSGRQYWEVCLEQKQSWWVGVMAESAWEKQESTCSPRTGFWLLVSDAQGGFRASTDPPVPLPAELRPAKLGVFLDREGGQLSFFNAESRSRIFTFHLEQQEKLYPLFNPGTGDKNPLSICPLNRD